jgi:hypothetical protein
MHLHLQLAADVLVTSSTTVQQQAHSPADNTKTVCQSLVLIRTQKHSALYWTAEHSQQHAKHCTCLKYHQTHTERNNKFQLFENNTGFFEPNCACTCATCFGLCLGHLQAWQYKNTAHMSRHNLNENKPVLCSTE